MATDKPLSRLTVGVVPLDEALGQAGLEFLQGILAGRYPMPPMSAVIPIAPLEIEFGRAEFRAVPDERFYNTLGLDPWRLRGDAARHRHGVCRAFHAQSTRRLYESRDQDRVPQADHAPN